MRFEVRVSGNCPRCGLLNSAHVPQELDDAQLKRAIGAWMESDASCGACSADVKLTGTIRLPER